MGNFSFDVPDATGQPANRTDRENGGEPGSNGGTDGVAGQNNGPGDANNGVEGSAATGTADAPKKRKGRQPYPRDANGNIIRPASTGTANDKSGKEGVVVNDRNVVEQNILGLHAMAAVLTKQPVLALSKEEGKALSIALCNVADYHGMNLISAGGAFGLYASLCTTCYLIYVPRIQAIKSGNSKIAGNSSEAPKPSETRERAMNGAGKVDFSNDVMH